MFIQKSKDLKTIYELQYKGHFNKALNKLKQLEKKDSVILDEKTNGKILEANIQKKLGYFEKALAIVDKAIIEAKKNSKRQLLIEGLLEKCDILATLYKIDELNDITTRIEKEISLLDEINENTIQLYKAKLFDLKFSNIFQDCNFEKAQQFIKKSLNYKKKLGIEIEIANTLYLYGRIQIMSNKNEDAKKKLLQAVRLQKKTKDVRGLIYSYYYLGWVFRNLNEFDKSNDYFKLCHNTCKEFGNEYDFYWGYVSLFLVTDIKNGPHEALKKFLQALEIAKQFENKHTLIHANTGISVMYHSLGRPKLAVQHIEESLDLFRALTGNKPSMDLSWVYRQAGVAYLKDGDMSLGKDYFEKAITISRNINDEHGVAAGHFYLGGAFNRLGLLDQALTCFSKSNELANRRKDERLKAWNARQFGLIYRRKGELQKAIDNIKIFQAFSEKSNNSGAVIDTYYDLAVVYLEKGDLDEALNNALICYEARKEPVREQRFAEVLFFLVRIFILRNEVDKAQLYANELEELNKVVSDVIINQRHRTASALLLKTSLRAANRAKAKSLLRAIVEEDVVRAEVTIVALINFCEQLLEEFRITGELNIIKELEVYTKRLMEIAQKQDSNLLKLEAQHIRILSLWLQAQHSISEINLNEIQSLLTNTQELAELKGLFGLAQRIFIKHNKMLDHLEVWDDFLLDYYKLIKDK
jgi:tetratricopeptide (TPR) repeat protein